jgi:S-disulfanyl-L-cysteine oxidoreductase SoxD
MKLQLAVIVFIGLTVLGAAAICQNAGRSTSDGVFTVEQANRGKASFKANCATCHGEQLDGGGESGPPLSGGDFMQDWSGQTVGDLVDRIHNTMPADNPGKLSREEDADIVAYILSVNKFPAGTKELPPDAELLKQIRISAAPPAK